MIKQQPQQAIANKDSARAIMNDPRKTKSKRHEARAATAATGVAAHVEWRRQPTTNTSSARKHATYECE